MRSSGTSSSVRYAIVGCGGGAVGRHKHSTLMRAALPKVAFRYLAHIRERVGKCERAADCCRSRARPTPTKRSCHSV
eukprot:7384910-Prymnesium_polylepis.1